IWARPALSGSLSACGEGWGEAAAPLQSSRELAGALALGAEGGALGAGAVGAQVAEVEDAGVVAVAPGDDHGVLAGELHRVGPDGGRDGGGIQQGLARHLLDARGAAAGQAEVPGG